MFLVSDGGSGVITDAFLDDALFGDSSSWEIDDNLHPIFYGLDSSLQYGTELISEAYRTLSQNYPKDKLAQYTTAYDAVQVLFFNIMKYQYKPIDWFRLGPAVFGDWNDYMNTISSDLTELSNYRRYIEPGCNHTIFRFPEYYSSTVEDITFLEWMTAMTGGKPSDEENWKNLSCIPGYCGETSLTPSEINACLIRTFGS